MEETATVGRQHRFYALRSVAKTTGWTTGWVLFYISSNVREKEQVEWAHHAPKIKTKVNSDASKSSQPSGKKLFPILKHMSKPMNHSEPHIDKETEKGE
jgi:hypothetical protein